MQIVYKISACFSGSAKPAVVSYMKVCMLKCCVAGTGRWLSGGYFKRSEREISAWTQAEQRLFSPASLTIAQANKFISDATPIHTFKSRFEYIKFLAAVRVKHAAVLHRKGGGRQV